MEEWHIPLVEIGGRKLKLFQGAMGVAISGANLASAVANEGGLGIIASVGLNESKRYLGRYEESSAQALRDEIELAKSNMNGNGALGVNIMRPLTNYESLVRTSIESGIKYIISGAALPLDLPKYIGDNRDVNLIPIASSAQAASIIMKRWKTKFDYTPAAIIIEGPKAGGHLGFKLEEIFDPKYSLENIIPEVVEVVQGIPVIAAGGIYYGGDIKKFLQLGASGVQMATRFVPTHECDANIKFKQAYLNCKKEDIIIIQSPVGLPGRAIRNKFLDEVKAGQRHPVECPYFCLLSCKQNESPYCIAKALVEASQGKFDNGYVFVGANAWRCKEDGIISVKNIFEKLDKEYIDGKISS
jgi:nitronate monooxygenase